jgi:glutathione S-transferase
MKQEIKMWGRATSVNVQKVAWVLAELELDHSCVDVGGAYGGLDDPAYIAMNPNQRIPTLIDGDTILWESNAICRYLVDHYGSETALKRMTPQSRAQADMWMEWFQNNVYANFIALFHQLVRLPPKRRDPAKRQAALEALCKSLALFDAELSDRKFILGDRLSLGDIPTGACLYRYYTMGIERPKLANLDRYYSDLQKRPSFRQAVMVDYSSLRGFD